MSLARAFTTRRVKQSIDAGIQRSNTTKAQNGSVRSKISGPIELIHTTNILSYNAPDIHPRSASSITSSTRSDSESDTVHTAASSPPTSPDVASPLDRSDSPEPNHLSCYFTAPKQAIVPETQEPPVIPRRAPSHTKKASFEALARSRSNSNLSRQARDASRESSSTKASYTFSRSSSVSTSTTNTSHTTASYHVPKVPSVHASPLPAHPKKEFSESHPFGHELAQVSEIAEEYGLKEQLRVVDEEEKDLAARGLCKFSAADYLKEIDGLIGSIFTDDKPETPLWI